MSGKKLIGLIGLCSGLLGLSLYLIITGVMIMSKEKDSERITNPNIGNIIYPTSFGTNYFEYYTKSWYSKGYRKTSLYFDRPFVNGKEYWVLPKYMCTGSYTGFRDDYILDTKWNDNSEWGWAGRLGIYKFNYDDIKSIMKDKITIVHSVDDIPEYRKLGPPLSLREVQQLMWLTRD